MDSAKPDRPHLTLTLFGRFQADLDGQVLTSFRTSKVQALLVYLASEPEPHRRDSLTELLWPGMPERSARHNLRQVLYYLRSALRELSASPDDEETTVPLLLANRQTIQLNPAAAVSTDIARFDELLDGVTEHEHLNLLSCGWCGEALEQAVALYQGDFLADFYLDDSNEFEDWAQLRREAYRRKVLDALEVLTSVATRQKNYVLARQRAERQLEIDDLRESSYRQMMEVLALSGHREEALAVYGACRRLLAEELGMQPARWTTEIYERIVAGELHFETPQTQGVRGYELKEEIGEGSYGTIYRAIQLAINREVAVKVIRQKYANNPEFIRRFEDEAHTVAGLEHPFVVPLYDYWRDPDGAYLVMRYLKGGSLLFALKQGPWNPEPVASMLDQVSAALNDAHQSGIVHRDLKPANILFDEAGNAYLSDFGIARDLERDRSLRDTGAVLVTPDYISPEQILAEQVGPRSDQYSLAAVLFETLTGEKPFGEAPIAGLLHKHLNEPFPLVAEIQPNLASQIDAVIQKASAKRPADRYDSVADLAAAFRAALSEAEVIHADVVPPVAPAHNPYKGLEAFQERDADDFFGRDVLIDQLGARLTPPSAARREHRAPGKGRFLALVGPSGSGKSSVVKAGLIPALRSGAIPGSEKWFVAEMVPGANPLEALETALWAIAVDPPPDLVGPMQRDVRGMLRTIRRILPGENEAELLLVIDQFEELFTLVEDDERREFFLESLLVALTAPRSPLRVVVTLRADFYDRPLQFQALGRLLKSSTEVVLPLSAEELTWAVREPARRVGVTLEPGLAEAIVADVIDQPGGLPLLQYALTELFERRQGRRLTHAAYQEIGGVLGALSRRAEGLFADLDAAGQEAARQLFLRLITLGEGVEDTRRRVPRLTLESLDASRMPGVIEAFGAGRLLTFDRHPVTRAPTVEVAHEALLRAWGRLRGWLDEGREAVRLQQQLAHAAGEWRHAGKDESYLLRGARLAQFESWIGDSHIALTEAESEFLSMSVAARQARRAEREDRRRRELETARKLAETEKARAETESRRAEEQAEAARRLRQRALLLAGVLVLTVALAIAAALFGGQANRNATLARSRELAAAANFRRGTDPELGLLLALEALSTAQTSEAEQALHVALLASRLRMRLTGHQSAIQRVAYSPDGRLIALGSHGDELASLWDAASGEKLHEFPLARCCWGLYFDEESRHLAAAEPGEHFSLAIWDVSTGEKRESLTLPISAAEVGGYYLHPDWTQAAVFLPGNTLVVWDLKKGERLFELSGHSGYVELEYSRDGRRLVSYDGQDGLVQVWDATTGELLNRLKTGKVINDHAVGPDGRRLALAVSLGPDQRAWEVQIWDLEASPADEEPAPTVRLPGHDTTIRLIDFSADGTMVASASEDGTSRIWDSTTGESLFVLQHASQVRSVVFHPEGTHLLSGDVEGVARVWDLTPAGAAERLGFNAHSDIIRSVDASPDGKTFITASNDGTAKVWDLATGKMLGLLKGHSGFVTAADFQPDGQRLATSGTDGTVRVWDPTSGRELYRVEGHGGGIVGGVFPGILNVAYSPDGDLLATAGADRTARIWDAESGEALRVLEGHTAGLTNVAFSPDGRYLATSQESTEDLNVQEGDISVRIWEVETGRELLVFQTGHGFFVWGLAFSPDGRILATSGQDANIKLWSLDLDGGRAELLGTLGNHAIAVQQVRFSPDGRRLASASFGEVRLWDLSQLVESGEEAAVSELLALPGGPGLAFNLDGTELITSGEEGIVRIYLLDPAELRAFARTRLTRWWTEEECRQLLHATRCPPEPH